MSKRIFITGSQGFVGKKLTVFLETKGYQVYPYSEKLENFQDLKQALVSFVPDVVIHLAALSSIPYCEQYLDQAYGSNVAGTSILLEILIKLEQKPHLIFTSSAHVYNMQLPQVSAKPIDESFDLGPSNIYGRSKLQAEDIVSRMSSLYGLKAVVLRLFNHSHKDQDLSFFLPSMYDQIKNVENRGTIHVGNLDVSRDFSLVSDLLEAMDAVIRNLPRLESYEVFNVCSGQKRLLKDLVTAITQMLRKEVNLVPDPKRIRPGEPLVIVGSNDKLKRKTGFQQPARSIEDYLQGFVSED